MTAEILASILGIILSLAANFVPHFSEWYAGLSAQYKRLVMLGFLALAALAAFGLSCANLGDLFGISGLTCDEAGAMVMLRAFLAAVIANQTTFLVTPMSDARRAKLAGIRLSKMDAAR